MTNDAPRDAIASCDVWVPVDATGDDFYALGGRFGGQAGVLHARHDATGQPYAAAAGVGFLDPRGLRWHDLQRATDTGVRDQRLAVQLVNDWGAEYADARPGDAPFGQPEWFTALNRSTREADTQGRVALPSSHRRIVDSEDGRYALALTCRSVPLEAADAPAPPGPSPVDGVSAPDGVVFREAGLESGTHGSVLRGRPSVAIGGVTYFGQAAVDAARDALARGGTARDAAGWAAAAALGLPRRPFEGAGAGASAGATSERPTPADEPAGELEAPDPHDGLVPLLDHPAGYVWSLAGRVGLLGTLVCPEGAHGHDFEGREGTRIGPLPLRHDAQVTMGKDLVGRIVFVRDDARDVPDGVGKPIKGELWADTGRANQDTALAHETLQWRPVLRVSADLPPSRPPPWDPPPWADPREDPDDEEGEREETARKRPPPPPGGGPPPFPPPAGGPGSGGDAGEASETFGRLGLPYSVRRVRPRGAGRAAGGDLEPVDGAASQVRDYEGPGEPCPNATAGVFVPGGVVVATGDVPGGTLARRVPGGWIEYLGHPALTQVPGGVVVGGVEGPIPLGLPGPHGGVVVVPAPDGVPAGARVPGDAPGRVPLGLPTPVDDRPGRVGIDPPLGGDRGVPSGAAERFEAARRRERARRAEEARAREERRRLEELEALELEAREQGLVRRADRLRHARERLARARARREERRRKVEARRERERQARDQARQRRRGRQEERQRRALEERARANRRREDLRARRPRRPAQGGYAIDTTDPDAERLSVGRLDEGERRRLEEDRRREDERKEAQGAWARFGDWNTANRPLAFLGAPGGPVSAEGWIQLATYAIRALQRTSTGAFGGPSHLASNLGVVHRNAPGNPPAGSRLGARWSVLPHDLELRVCGEPVVEAVSVLEARAGTTARACGGAVLRVAREHRGEGLVEDDRPLVLLDDAQGRTAADLVRDVRGRFRVDHDRGVTAARVGVRVPCGQRGPALEVVRACEGRAPERLVAVEDDGTLVAAAGARVARTLALEPGAVVELRAAGGAPRARLALDEDGLALSVLGAGGAPRVRLLLTDEGAVIDGPLRVRGPVTARAFKQA